MNNLYAQYKEAHVEAHRAGIISFKERMGDSNIFLKWEQYANEMSKYFMKMIALKSVGITGLIGAATFGGIHAYNKYKDKQLIKSIKKGNNETFNRKY